MTNETSSPGEEGEKTLSAKVLGRGWVECSDEIHGRPYFAHLPSGKTSWTFPEDLLNDDRVVNHPDHWIEAVDVVSHKKYFYNRITKESRWVAPALTSLVQGSDKSRSILAPENKKSAMLTALNDMKEKSEEDENVLDLSNQSTKEIEQQHNTQGAEERYAETVLHSVAISTEELYSKCLPGRTLINYGKLNFATARSGIFKRKQSVEKLLQWSSKGLKDPLHNMQGEMLEEAVQFSKNIRGFMGDRSSTKSPLEHADKIIKVLLLSNQDLRDEFFCQLCKQLNNNPSKVSALKGWQLFLICLTSAAPNNELMISLIDFFRGFIEGDDKDISSYAEDTLHKCYIATQLQGARVERPNTAEIAAIMSANYMQIRVWFLDGLYLTVKCDSWVVVSELELMIAQQLGVKTPENFGLYEALSSGEERLLHYDDRVLDLVAQWKRFQDDGSHIDEDCIKFVYKVRYFVEIEDVDDSSSIELMYIQAVHDVLNMIDLCKSEDALDLAALQLHVKFGDREEIAIVNALERDLESYVPERVFELTDRQYIVQAVLKRYSELQGYTALESRLEYLKLVREIPSYGSSYFLVQGSSRQGSKSSKEVVVSINPRGFFVIDNYTKEYIESYLYASILTWGHSTSQFILAVGSNTNKKTITYKCSSGKEMSKMLSVYVSKQSREQ